MIVESKLVETYLNKEKYHYGLVVSILFLSICIVASLFYWSPDYPIKELLGASPYLIFEKKEYWRLFTTLFTHADIEHLLSNSLMLFFLMYFVTSFFGYWISIALSLIMGAVINYFVLMSFNSEATTLVGISGVIYYLWGLWFILYLFIDETISLPRRLVKVFGIFLILLVPTSYAPQTSYLAHYLGFAIGFATGLIVYPLFRKKTISYKRWENRIVHDFEQEEKELE